MVKHLKVKRQFAQLRQDLGIDPSLFGGGGPPDPPALDDDEEEEVDPIAQQMQLDREFANNKQHNKRRNADRMLAPRWPPFLTPTV
jgi:hypothetical protein